MDWTDTWRDAFRTELRAEAISFACHGWPVVPGSYPHGSAWVGQDGRDGAVAQGPAPVHAEFATLAGCGPERVAALWDGRPFSVLLATGLGVDALELPAELGRATAVGLRVAGLPVPIAAAPSGRWLFPVIGGGALHPALARHPGVALHGIGSWIPLPPSPLQAGVVHWRVKPDVCGWRLPPLADIEHALLDAVEDPGTHRLSRR